MMRINFKSTKKTKKQKNIKVLKILKKKYNVINFKTIRYKLTALGKIIHSILNYNLLRQVSKHLKNELKKLFYFQVAAAISFLFLTF